jgi:lysophospholipase L1-like esterase
MTTMICIGDSLTEGTDIPVGHTWPALVANALSLEVINCGIGGDTTNGMLSRFYPDVVDRRPAFVFIMGGTNDLWWGWEFQYHSRQSFLHGRPGPPPWHRAGHRPARSGQCSCCRSR